MKKFILKCISVFVPVVLVMVWIFLSSHNKKFAYSYLKEDCYDHASWIYERVVASEMPIDIAFIGSSRTIQAIFEDSVENVLKENFGVETHIANLGYCRLGRNLHYVLLKDLIENKDPQLIVLEVRETEDRYSHPVYPHLASSKDLYNSTLLFNRDYISDIADGTGSRLEFFKRKTLRMLPKPRSISNTLYGYGAATDTADTISLNRIMKKRDAKQKSGPEFISNINNRFPKSYINRIADLCHEHKIDLSFIFIPEYGNPRFFPELRDFLTNKAELWIPPESIFRNENNWMDENHLNYSGAAELAAWLAGKLNNSQDKEF